MSFDKPNSQSIEKRIIAMLDALVDAGILDKSQLAHICELLVGAKTPLDHVLCKLGIVSEKELAEFYSEYFQAPLLDNRQLQLSTHISDQLAPQFLKDHRIAPINSADHSTIIVMVDPMDHTAIAGMKFALGPDISFALTTATEMERLLASLPEAEIKSEIARATSDTLADDAARLKDLASGEPAIRLVDRLVSQASEMRVSDIHLEPKERSMEVRFRIDGVLSAHETLTKAQGVSAVSRLKILSNLDIAERRRPQDGRFSFPVAGQSMDLRVSTTPTIFGESVVLRLLEKTTSSLGLAELGFLGRDADALRRLISRPNGILLVTGPTGSGKTTTLYALLEILAKEKRKILTIEDPVEYQIEGVSQTQVNPAIDLNFANAMRSFLRHDPDVIMVGEMRDLETARIAVQASLTGHLVLSTLHTNDASSAITRLLDMGVEDYLVASTLIGIVGQRLARKICSKCKRGGAYCAVCLDTGYKGRTAIAEIMMVNNPIKASLKTGVTSQELYTIATENGFRSMSENGAEKIIMGVTSPEEVERVLGA